MSEKVNQPNKLDVLKQELQTLLESKNRELPETQVAIKKLDSQILELELKSRIIDQSLLKPKYSENQFII